MAKTYQFGNDIETEFRPPQSSVRHLPDKITLRAVHGADARQSVHCPDLTGGPHEEKN